MDNHDGSPAKKWHIKSSRHRTYPLSLPFSLLCPQTVAFDPPDTSRTPVSPPGRGSRDELPVDRCQRIERVSLDWLCCPCWGGTRWLRSRRHARRDIIHCASWSARISTKRAWPWRHPEILHGESMVCTQVQSLAYLHFCPLSRSGSGCYVKLKPSWPISLTILGSNNWSRKQHLMNVSRKNTRDI